MQDTEDDDDQTSKARNAPVYDQKETPQSQSTLQQDLEKKQTVDSSLDENMIKMYQTSLLQEFLLNQIE